MTDVAGSLLTIATATGSDLPDKRRAGYKVTTPTFIGSSNPDKRREGNIVNLGDSGTQTITYYVMRAVDNNAGTTPPTYRIWTVAGNPDYVAGQYSGPYSGTGVNFSLADIIRIDTI